MPKEGYLKAIKAMCEKIGTLFIADEVQTGLMRSGEMWCIQTYGVVPDMIVTGKGLSGGIYPISAVDRQRALRRLAEGGRLGPYVHLRRRRARLHRRRQGLEICSRPETRSQFTTSPTIFARASARSRRTIPDFFVGIRQRGPIMGLEFDHPEGAEFVMRAATQRHLGDLLRARPARAAVQAGLLADRELCDDILNRLDTAVGQARSGRLR